MNQRNKLFLTLNFQEATNVEEEDWYHGVLPRKEVERLLEKKGDYLVRMSQKKDGTVNYVLSVGWEEENSSLEYKHFIIQGEEVFRNKFMTAH